MTIVRTAFVAAVLLTTSSANAEDPYLDRFRKAQPIISATVEAHGGVERLQAIQTLKLSTEGENFQRYQSKRLGPPFDSQPNRQTIELDVAGGQLKVDSENGQNRNLQIATGDTTYQFNPVTKIYTEGPATAVDQHFVHRIVPALLARKLYERANSVLWIGESTVEGAPADALAITWANGAQYVVHVDQATKLITQYDILFPDPVAGDGVFKSVFSEYRDHDGLPFPDRRVQTIAGEPTFAISTKSIAINPDLSGAFAIPEGYTLQEGGGGNAEFEQLGDGVYLAGGNYRTLFVDLGDTLVAIDAGGQPAQAQQGIATARERSGGKSLSTVVLTHHHSDHIQAVGSYIAEGARVMTHRPTADLVRKVLAASFAAANTPAAPEVKPKFDYFRDKKVLSGGGRTVELYNVANDHAENYIVAYVPHLKLLYGADVFGFPLNGPPQAANDALRDFMSNLAKRDLDVERVANAHGRVAEFAELRARLADGGAVDAAP